MAYGGDAAGFEHGGEELWRGVFMKFGGEQRLGHLVAVFKPWQEGGDLLFLCLGFVWTSVFHDLKPLY